MSPSRFVPASPNYSVVRKVRAGATELPVMPWMHRLKTDHRLSQPPFRAKSPSQVLQVAMSPFWSVTDTVFPSYLKTADVKFLNSLENLIVAVRGLTSNSYKNAHQMLRRIPLYHDILQVLSTWDLESIREEWTTFRREPRSRNFGELEPLAQLILKPVYKLSRLNPHVHILPALSKMLDLALMYMTNEEERDRLKRFYGVARVEVSEHFSMLRLNLYPVLIKILGTRFVEPEEFFIDHDEAILKWLGLTEADLLVVTEETSTAPPQEDEAGIEVPETPSVPRLAELGFILLDQMFPKAGWLKLDTHPDLYAYFQPVLEAPKGSDLIAVDDPLQVVLPLSEILQQLFYGFQSVQWGFQKTASGEVLPLQDRVDKIVARWHFFVEEFFGKNYLPVLQEYCREVERSGPVAADARQKEHQLLWFQRNYALPILSLPVMTDVRAKSLGYPNLAVQVRELLDLLSPAAVDWLQNGNSDAILNPETKVQFPITNAVTVRFKAMMRRSQKDERKIIDQGTNRSLVLSSVVLLSSLDFLLSNESSPLYAKRPLTLYRSTGALGEEKPIYNAPLKNTLALMRKLHDRPPPFEQELPWVLPTSETVGVLSVRQEIHQRIQELVSEKRAFSVVSLHVWPESRRDQFPLFWKEFAPRQILHRLDDGSWMATISESLDDPGERLLRAVLAAAAEREPRLAVAALLIPFFSQWTLEKVLSLPAVGWAEAKTIPPQILGVWSAKAQGFEFRTDVPTVVLEEPADEDAEKKPTTDGLPEV